MDLLKWSEKDKQEIWNKYAVNEDTIKRDVAIIEEWLTKQQHLPHEMPFPNFIEKVLLNSKFMVEVAKDRLDTFFTMKNRTKPFYDLFAGPEFVLPTQSSIGIVPLPQLGPEKERIIVIKMINPDPDMFEFSHYVQASLALKELILRYDYCDGLRMIVDFSNFGMGHIKKIDFAGLMTIVNAVDKKSWFRLVGVEVFNFKPYQNVIMNVVRATLKPKLADRINVHTSLESLQKRVPKNYLNLECGGILGTFLDYVGGMESLIEDNRQYLIDCPKYASDESRRIGTPKYEMDMYGINGTFKKLNVD